MLYYLRDLKYEVQVLPVNLRDINKNDDITWKGLVAKKARIELDGEFDPDLGYIVSVICINKVEEGIIQPQTGLIKHIVSYDALVEMPSEGEVVDVVIRKIKPRSIIFTYMGYINGIIRYEDFFSEDDFDFKETVDKDNRNPIPVYLSVPDPSKIMMKDKVIRIRILKREFGNSGFWLQGSINGKFLGLRKSQK